MTKVNIPRSLRRYSLVVRVRDLTTGKYSIRGQHNFPIRIKCCTSKNNFLGPVFPHFGPSPRNKPKSRQKGTRDKRLPSTRRKKDAYNNSDNDDSPLGGRRIWSA